MFSEVFTKIKTHEIVGIDETAKATWSPMLNEASSSFSIRSAHML